MRTHSRRRIALVLGDLVVFIAALAFALYLRHGGMPESGIIRGYLVAGPILALLWIACLIMFGLYDFKVTKNGPDFFERLARALDLDVVVTIVLFYTVPIFGLRPLGLLVIFFPMLGLAAFGERFAANAVLTHRNRERIIFFGAADEIIELAEFLKENPQLGFNPVAIVRSENGATPPHDALAIPEMDNLSEAIKISRATTIVVAPNLKRTKSLIKTLFDVVPLGITITDFPRFYETVRGKVPVSLINETWFVENLVGSRRPRYEFAKRILDTVLATIFGLFALLLFPFIAIAIVASAPQDIFDYRNKRARPGDGIIFFRQERVGKNGKIFGFIKFRSQVLGAELMGHEKSTADPRAYPVGTFLRKTYLDELPQLLNVLRGDMSFVGPRPERPKFVRELEQEIPFYRMRELVIPGITGWAQINMTNDASVSDAPEKMQYDLFYIKNRSLALDITILLKTAWEVLQRSGR